MSKLPDPTPPSAPLPTWATDMIREFKDMKKIVGELRQTTEYVKSKQAADALAFIHLLSGIAQSTTGLKEQTTQLNKQVWGAIKELRAQVKESRK